MFCCCCCCCYICLQIMFLEDVGCESCVIFKDPTGQVYNFGSTAGQSFLSSNPDVNLKFRQYFCKLLKLAKEECQYTCSWWEYGFYYSHWQMQMLLIMYLLVYIYIYIYTHTHTQLFAKILTPWYISVYTYMECIVGRF